MSRVELRHDAERGARAPVCCCDQDDGTPVGRCRCSLTEMYYSAHKLIPPQYVNGSQWATMFGSRSVDIAADLREYVHGGGGGGQRRMRSSTSSRTRGVRVRGHSILMFSRIRDAGFVLHGPLTGEMRSLLYRLPSLFIPLSRASHVACHLVLSVLSNAWCLFVRIESWTVTRGLSIGL